MKTLLLLNHNQRNLELLAEFLQKAGYESLGATTLESFDQLLSDEQTFSLALVDISGFDFRIWERCELLRQKNIPLLIISAQASMTVQQESLSHGAQGVLTKPLVIKDLITFVHNLLAEPL